MLVPALFAASEIKARSARGGHSIDVLVFANPSDLTDGERHWMAERDIGLEGGISTIGWERLVLDSRLAPSTMVKLALAPYLADRYDKVLYLDADITVHEDITPLFAVETGDAPIAAAPAGRQFLNRRDRDKTEAHFEALGMSTPYRFFNSGVMLIDVKKWNDEKIGERAIEFVGRNPQLCYLPDEHGLNAVLDGRFAQLSPIWNTRIFEWRSPLVRKLLEPVLVHYDGPNKPWKKFGKEKRLFGERASYNLYADFVERSPWPNWLDEQWTPHDLWENIWAEWKGFSRALRGRPRQPIRSEYMAYISAFIRTCLEWPFADIEQGITARSGGRLRLNQRPPDAHEGSPGSVAS